VAADGSCLEASSRRRVRSLQNPRIRGGTRMNCRTPSIMSQPAATPPERSGPNGAPPSGRKTEAERVRSGQPNREDEASGGLGARARHSEAMCVAGDSTSWLARCSCLAARACSRPTGSIGNEAGLEPVLCRRGRPKALFADSACGKHGLQCGATTTVAVCPVHFVLGRESAAGCRV